MIVFQSETKFKLPQKKLHLLWLKKIVANENKILGDINYIFCDDDYLLKINIEYLNHDTYTDVITFDYTEKNKISGDIFISIQRIEENANTFNVLFEEELLRVMSHGIFHLCGYNDKTSNEEKIMREKEDIAILMFEIVKNMNQSDNSNTNLNHKLLN